MERVEEWKEKISGRAENVSSGETPLLGVSEGSKVTMSKHETAGKPVVEIFGKKDWEDTRWGDRVHRQIKRRDGVDGDCRVENLRGKESIGKFPMRKKNSAMKALEGGKGETRSRGQMLGRRCR